MGLQAPADSEPAEQLLPRSGFDNELTGATLVDDLADVLVRMTIGWEDTLGVDLSQHPDVVRVMARYRAAKALRTTE